MKRIFRDDDLKRKFLHRNRHLIAILTFLFNLIQFSSVFHFLFSFYLKVSPLERISGYRIFFLSISVLSFLLWFIAKIQLGTSFSVLPATPNKLIKNGMYSLFRHPIYIFSMTTMVSYILLIEKPQFFFGLFLLLPLQIFRSRKEHALLISRFGEEYENHAKQCWI